MTAWTGLMNIGQPKAGETLVVAAASGAVGSVVGQLAKLKGCRAVGIAGGEKQMPLCRQRARVRRLRRPPPERFPRSTQGRLPEGDRHRLRKRRRAVFDAVLPLLNTFARVPVCGLIAHYNATELPTGVDRVPLLMRQVLTKRLTLRGFIVFDFAEPATGFSGRGRPAGPRRPHQIPRGHCRGPRERPERPHRAAEGGELRQGHRARLERGPARLSGPFLYRASPCITPAGKEVTY